MSYRNNREHQEPCHNLGNEIREFDSWKISMFYQKII